VYDKKMLWWANMYIDEGANDYNGHAWRIGRLIME